MNVTALLRRQTEFFGEEDKNVNQTIVFLAYLFETILTKFAATLVLVQCYRDEKTSYFFNPILNNALDRVNAQPPTQMFTLKENSTSNVFEIGKFNLIFVDCYESFRAIDVASRVAKKHSSESYYILLHAPNRSHLVHMERIFDYCWNHQLLDCNVQLKEPNGNLLIYSYFPYTPEKCGNVRPKLINQFDGNKLEQPIIFPQKLSNFYGCVLRVATWELPPFVSLKAEVAWYSRIGIERRLVRTLERKLNFTMEIIVPPNDEEHGSIIGGNVTGALRMLVENSTDLSFGAFRLSADHVEFGTPTFSYYQNVQILLVNLRDFELTSLEILLFPFFFSTWLLFLSIALLSIFALTALRKAHRYFSFRFIKPVSSNYYLQVILLILGMSVFTEPKRNFARILFIVWIFATIIFRTGYQALLFHLLRTRLTNPVPQSIEDIAAQNYTAVVSGSTYFNLVQNKNFDSVKFHVVNGTGKSLTFIYLEKSHAKKLVAIEALVFLLHYVRVNKKHGIFKTLPSHVYNVPITIFLRKHSFLTDQFSSEILKFCSVGLIEAWSHLEVEPKYMNTKDNLTDNVFGIRQLYMAFVLWLAGCSLGFVCFLFEILLKRYRNKIY